MVREFPACHDGIHLFEQHNFKFPVLHDGGLICLSSLKEFHTWVAEIIRVQISFLTAETPLGKVMVKYFSK